MTARAGVSWPQGGLRALTATGLVVDAAIHLHLAPQYQLAAPGGIGQGNLFRIQAASALVSAGFVLLRGSRMAYLVAAVTAAGALAAVVVYRYLDVPPLGPMPAMYEPVWFPEKTATAVAEAVAVVSAVVAWRNGRQSGRDAGPNDQLSESSRRDRPGAHRRKSMKKSKKTLAMLAPTLALGAGMLAMATGPASAAGSSTFQAQLNPINHSSASGNLTLSLNGSQATITEHVTGLAATFGGKPYPHVQHIHIGAMGTCPGTSADKNGDGVISTTEGAPSYGGIGTTLSTSGDTSPAAGTTLTVAPSGSTINYSRTITLDSKTLASVQGGTAVIVVHGLDPATLSKQAQGEKSDLVPSLPLAATSPAACGTLVASQMTAMPGGAAGTGGGSTSGVQDQGLLALGGVLLAGGAVAGGAALRRRTADAN